jgi:hypothetical protein
MKDKTFFSYRLFIWMLLLIAMILGGGYLIIAYSYNLQKETEKRIDAARHSVVVLSFTLKRHAKMQTPRKREPTMVITWQHCRKSGKATHVLWP